MKQSNDGFTLLEILVVLIITTMMVAILLQGLQQVFLVDRQVGTESFRSQEGLMRAEWYRGVIKGLFPDYYDGSYKFSGKADRLSGLTISPLDGNTSTVAAFEMKLRFDPEHGQMALSYGDSPAGQQLLDWPGSNGRFRYLDADGKSHDEWPPFLGKWPQLPAAVILEPGESAVIPVLIAAPTSAQKPPPRKRDFADG